MASFSEFNMAPQAHYSANIAEVDRLLQQLQRNLDDAKLSLKQQEVLLRQVKVIGRDPRAAGPIFAKQGISTLSKYGLDYPTSETSKEALRCLANAFLLNESCRQIFVDLDYAPKAAERLKSNDLDDEFVISRILFLLTYNTSTDFEALVNQHDLANSINKHTARHSEEASTLNGTRSLDSSPMGGMAMVETLKLLFNITYHNADLISSFDAAIEPIIKLIMHHPLPSPPLQSPISPMLNALLNLRLECLDASQAKPNPLFPAEDPESVINRLIDILDQAIHSTTERDLDTAAAPLCTLLRKVYELAPTSAKSQMRHRLLPSTQSRDQVLGKDDSLASRLLRLTASPNLPSLRDNISALLFELSDSDANKFVRNVGYGYAAGFLHSRSIGVPPQNPTNGAGASDAEDVNPVTGQRLAAEQRDAPSETLPEMTEEEKAREAERLFVLFERLKATGVVDVKNPVEVARDEGRFEEVD